MVDDAGNVYVADYETKWVQKFDAEGNFVTRWGTGKAAPGTPEGLALDRNGRLYVTDYDRNRVEVYTTDGEFVAAWNGGEDGRFARPVALAFDSNGHVYVSNQASHTIQKFAPPPLP